MSLKARKTDQLVPPRIDEEERQVIEALKSTGLNESEAQRTCINTFGRAAKAIEENDRLKARVAELEAQLSTEEAG